MPSYGDFGWTVAARHSLLFCPPNVWPHPLARIRPTSASRVQAVLGNLIVVPSILPSVVVGRYAPCPCRPSVAHRAQLHVVFVKPHIRSASAARDAGGQ
jgi:hypothetical protein